MRRKYFSEEQVFEFIWQRCDNDGIWSGDAENLAAKFDVTEDEAHEMLSLICDGRHVEKLYPGTYAISKWRERDDRDEEELPS